MKPPQPPTVAAVFDSYPRDIRNKLLALRALIFEVAATTAGVGELEETLKWGEPAYLTSQSKSGSTIRIDWKASKPEQYAMYFICTTGLVDAFRMRFADDFTFEGNRAIVFGKDDPIPREALAFCVGMALTYQQEKQK